MLINGFREATGEALELSRELNQRCHAWNDSFHALYRRYHEW